MITPSFSLTATERVLPKLALDFTTASLDSRVTFTRTGNTATVVNSSGYIAGINANLPRFDFNPTTLVCSGLLIEESRINVMTYSEDISQFPTKTNTTVSVDQINAPTNQLTADKIIETTATGNHLIFKGNPVVSGTTYTCSVFLKKGERFRVRLRTLTSLTDTQVDFNLDAGTITSGTAGTITNYGNGWYRCTITSAATATDSNGRFYIYLLDDSGAVSYTGITDYGLYAWGAQVEAGAFATSYIPNLATGSTTRNADVASMTGTNFSDWFNQTEGTLVLQNQYSDIPTGSGRVPVSINTDASNFMQIYTRLGTINGALGQVVAATQWVNAGSTASTAVFKTAFAYKLNDIQMATNGVNVFTDNTANIPTVNQLVFPSGNCGYVQKLNYYPMRLTSAEVIAFSKQ